MLNTSRPSINYTRHPADRDREVVTQKRDRETVAAPGDGDREAVTSQIGGKRALPAADYDHDHRFASRN